MSRRGFTLFEVILALAIVVILMGTIAGTLRLAFKSKGAAEEALQSVHDVQTVGDIWASEVSCATPPSPLTADPDSLIFGNAEAAATQADPNAALVVAQGGINGMQIDTGAYLSGPFRGTEVSLQFYATGVPSKNPTPAGVIYVEYYMAPQPDGRQALVRRINTNLLADSVDEASLPEEVLITGVTGLEFKYFDGESWDNQPQWDTSSSATNNQLPYAVKMILTLEPTHPNGPSRTLTRCATIWCAQKTVNDYNNAVDASANSTTVTPGIGG